MKKYSKCPICSKSFDNIIASFGLGFSYDECINEDHQLTFNLLPNLMVDWYRLVLFDNKIEYNAVFMPPIPKKYLSEQDSIRSAVHITSPILLQVDYWKPDFKNTDKIIAKIKALSIFQ